MNRLRPRTAAAITVAVLSLSITPMAVQGSAWASSGGGSSKASSSKRSTSYIAHSGAEGNASGASSGEDSNSTGGHQPSNPKRAKIGSSRQKVHTKNTQAFQKVVLSELKKRPEGLLAQKLTDTLVTSGTLDARTSLRVTLAALNALEEKEAVEEVADSSPTKYRITEKGRGLTSLMREPLTTEELKDQITTLLEGYRSSTGLTQNEIFRGLGYSGSAGKTNHVHNDLLGQMVTAGELALTPQGRYILPPR